jgi:hypothetical protein
MFHVEHFWIQGSNVLIFGSEASQASRLQAYRPILHIDFHQMKSSMSSLKISNLVKLFHVEQSIYPLDSTKLRHCHQGSALLLLRNELLGIL